MAKTAGFLKFIETVGLVFEVIAAIFLAFLEVFFAVIGNFSDIAAKTGNAITISGGTMTPAEMDAFKPAVMVVIAIGLVSVIFGIIGTLKTRKTLKEIQEMRPFSPEAVKSIKTAAQVEIIGGIAGIIGSLILTFMVSNLTVNGTSLGNTSVTMNLTFIIDAVQKYMFYHIMNYGNQLEKY